MFNESLDDTNFASFKESMHNDKLKKVPLPATLVDNFNIACKWSKPSTSSGKGENNNPKAVFYTAKQTKAWEAKKARNAAAAATAKKAAKVPAKAEPTVKADGQRKKTQKKRVSPESGLCFTCHKPGHQAKDCPHLDDLDSDEGSEFLASDDESNTSEIPTKGTKNGKSVKWRSNNCRMIASVSNTPSKYLMALDNCAYSSVMCNKEFVSDIVLGKCAPLLNWNGEEHANEASGMIHPFGYCELNKNAPINLLSEFCVRASFRIVDKYADDKRTGNPISKVIIVGTFQIEFKLDTDTRQYVADWRLFTNKFDFSPKRHSVNVVISSVKQNEARFSKDEVRRAKLAQEFIAYTGYASKEDVIRMITSSGNFINIGITRADVQRAIDIYGSQHTLMGRSRIMRPDTRVIRAQPTQKRPQDLYCDKFAIAGVWFMLCNTKPLGVLFVKYMEGQTEALLGAAFQEFTNVLASYKYPTATIYSDGDTAAVANVNRHEGNLIEICGAGDHVNEAETCIKTIKERFRSVKAGLIFQLTKRLVIELVTFIIGRLNLSFSQHSTDGQCPRVRLTGVILDANKTLNAGFGYLVVARNKNVVSNDAMAVRCEVCLLLNPTNNRQGSWRMMKLTTGKIVVRTQYKIVAFTDIAKARCDELAALENAGNPICVDAEVEFDEPPDIIDDDDFENDRGLRYVTFDFPITHSLEVKEEGGGFIPVPVPVNIEKTEVILEEVDDLADDDFDDDNVDLYGLDNAYNMVPEITKPKYSVKQQVSADGGASYVTGSSDRNARARLRSVNMIAGRRLNTKKRMNLRNTYVPAGNFNITSKAGVEKYGAKRSFKAQFKEIKSLVENGTFEGILPKNLTKTQKKKIIRSFVILKENFNAEGDLEKLKARLVANGAQMDPTTFADVSSPTVSLTFLLMMVVIAARERRTVATMDIGSAFVKASMDGEDEVLVHLDQLTSALLIKIDPSFQKFLNDKSEMTVKLKKALYGCLQSAKLWFELLVKELMDFGYEQNYVDPCVLNRLVDGKQSTILLHVDDIMILSETSGESKDLYAYLESKFGKVTLHEGVKHNYLGMTFDFSTAGRVTISMLGYENDLVRDWFEIPFDQNVLLGREKFASTPAINNIFDKGESPLLNDKNSGIFHSYVMRVAYLAKRVKPELSVAVSYMSTQVTKPNENDLRKLDRSIRYVRDHVGAGITLIAKGTGKIVEVTAHIDASFGCHENGKSHTGVCISLGDGPVFVRSVKQKIVTKSSTEAELVALSDEAGLLFHIEDFLKSQGYVSKIVIGQDNQSTIAMVSGRTKESMRTRHIKVRYYWLRERVKLGDIKVEYVPTADMLADILTKPMQGAMYKKFVESFCCRGELVPAWK